MPVISQQRFPSLLRVLTLHERAKDLFCFEVFGVSEDRDSVVLMRGFHFHRR